MTSNNNSDVGGIDTAKLDPNRPLASYIDPAAPSVPAIVNLRLSFLECAERMMDRCVVSGEKSLSAGLFRYHLA